MDKTHGSPPPPHTEDTANKNGRNRKKFGRGLLTSRDRGMEQHEGFSKDTVQMFSSRSPRIEFLEQGRVEKNPLGEDRRYQNNNTKSEDSITILETS
ncbi:hypothetical protein HZH68_002922 [Vespula germanica]|uniref:Uncharacterized protein n=1 Tax=Vespula germanica TaxID=30212 RepID=A0A834U2E9_VESGE|nr:hypothetical protein HZH68_002922 [Vespula germanica]